MKKLLLIPRAIADLLSVWKGGQTWKQKSSFTYTVAQLKLQKWMGPEDSMIEFSLLGKHWRGCNNETLQHLIKEIFLKEVYQVKHVPKTAPIQILDAGSNIGLSVLYFRIAFPNATIEAYEPNRQSFDLLQQNVAQNGLQKIMLQQGAVTGNEEALFLVEGFGPCSQNQQFSTTGNRNHPVPSQRLTDLLRSKQFDVVKLDVEGSELDILSDVIAAKCLDKVACWLIEFHYPVQEIEWVLNEFKRQGFGYSCKMDVYCFQKKCNHKY